MTCGEKARPGREAFHVRFISFYRIVSPRHKIIACFTADWCHMLVDLLGSGPSPIPSPLAVFIQVIQPMRVAVTWHIIRVLLYYTGTLTVLAQWIKKKKKTKILSVYT